MQDICTMISTLRRPRLLVAAARHGLLNYDRARHLPRVLQIETLPSPGPAAMQLIELEAGYDRARREGQATYSVARHIDVLVALMSEAGLLRDRTEMA